MEEKKEIKNKFILGIYKFLCVVGHVWWVAWSNVRWRKSCKKINSIYDKEKSDEKIGIEDIENIAKKVFKSFTYKNDGLDQLYDSIIPPVVAYDKYLSGAFSDDCDGFHSLMHYIISEKGVECYLLSVNTFGEGHCVLLFKVGTLWSVLDYNAVYTGYSEPKEMIAQYNDLYRVMYGAKSKAVFNGLVNFNYKTNKFESVKIKNLK